MDKIKQSEWNETIRECSNVDEFLSVLDIEEIHKAFPESKDLTDEEFDDWMDDNRGRILTYYSESDYDLQHS